MRAAVGSLVIFTLVLLGIAALRGDGTLREGLHTGAAEGLRFLPVLALAFVIMGLVEVLLPREVVEGWLSDSAGWRGIAIAWAGGALTPAGSIVGLPLAVGLYRAGVDVAVLVTYLTSVALLSLVRLPLELGFLGPRLTALRIIASLIAPPIAGVIARVLAPLFGMR